MPRYYFDLQVGGDTVQDNTGVELPYEQAARTHGDDVTRELMRNNERRSRHWCLLVRDQAGEILFRIPFVAVDPTIDHLPSHTRALVERGCEQRHAIGQAVREVRRTIRRARALVARSRGVPYLAVRDGERLT